VSHCSACGFYGHETAKSVREDRASWKKAALEARARLAEALALIEPLAKLAQEAGGEDWLAYQHPVTYCQWHLAPPGHDRNKLAPLHGLGCAVYYIRHIAACSPAIILRLREALGGQKEASDD